MAHNSMGLILLDFLQLRSGTILILMPTDDTMAGSIILNNRYQLEERVGSGGMAVVYRARDLELERLVAIKVLREDYSSDEAFRERFRQERKSTRLNSSHGYISYAVFCL